jgi:hypothetical protein
MKNTRKFPKSERGQALIIITFAIIGLIGLTGLVVDGGMAYSDRRHAQNAADSAAFAAALAHTRDQDITTTAKNITTTNGYDDNQVSNIVTVTTEVPPEGSCPEGAVDNLDITVDIVSHMDTSFARVVGIKQMTNHVFATSRACGIYIAPIFGGNAIVSVNPNLTECGINTGNSNAKKWNLIGGGLFSNGCVEHPNGTLNIPDDKCITAVGDIDMSGGGNHDCVTEDLTANRYTYPDDILAMMPPNPCDGTAGDVGLLQPSVVDGKVELTNGVYCITDFDAYDKADIVLDNATMYVTDMKFKLQFAGGGGFSGTPTETGTYSSYYMIIAYDPTPCEDFNSNNAQVVQYRGNGGGDPLYGTVLAPSACIDLRGNANGEAVHSQIIGYNVSSNGDAKLEVEYDADEQRRDPVSPAIQLLK